MKRTIWIVVYVLAAFNFGYWGNEYVNQRLSRARVIGAVRWALSENLFTVNEDRLSELEGLDPTIARVVRVIPAGK